MAITHTHTLFPTQAVRLEEKKYTKIGRRQQGRRFTNSIAKRKKKNHGPARNSTRRAATDAGSEAAVSDRLLCVFQLHDYLKLPEFSILAAEGKEQQQQPG